MQKRNRSIFKHILVSYFLALNFLGLFINLYRNRFFDNSWTIGEWLITYQGGFVRRGLGGSLIYTISSRLNINPIYIVQIICFVLFILFLYLLKDCKKYFSILFLFSPIVSLSPLLGNYIVRKDICGIVAYALCTKLIIKHKKLTSFLVVNIISSISILNHESYFFFALPSLILLYSFSLKGNKKFLLLKSLCFLMPSIITSFICFYMKGNLQIAFEINKSWEQISYLISTRESVFSTDLDGAINSLSWSLKDAISIPLSTMTIFVGKGFLWLPAVWMLTIFLAAQIFVGDRNKCNAKLKANILLIQFASISPLFIFGSDFGRWIFLWISSSIFLTISIIKINYLNNEIIKKIQNISPKCIVNNLRGYELNGWKKYLYLFINIPGCCWSIKNYLITTSVFYPVSIFTH
tara:strand:- start:5660 stop:6883 length:1224 start_codon:yes stop_codon:yes gene_type:complete